MPAERAQRARRAARPGGREQRRVCSCGRPRVCSAAEQAGAAPGAAPGLQLQAAGGANPTAGKGPRGNLPPVIDTSASRAALVFCEVTDSPKGRATAGAGRQNCPASPLLLRRDDPHRRPSDCGVQAKSGGDRAQPVFPAPPRSVEREGPSPRLLPTCFPPRRSWTASRSSPMLVQEKY